MTVVFNTRRRQFDPHRDTLACTSDCPACDCEVHFWLVDMVGHSRKGEDDDPGLFMMPTSTMHLDFESYADKVPAEVLQYCLSAQDVYLSGNLTAANVLIQASLDAIFNDFLSHGEGMPTLPRVVKESMEKINQNEPMVNIWDEMTSGGTLDILFKHHELTSQETADAMMALLETLITYLYVVPGKFKELQEQFEKINQTSKLSRRGDEDTPEILKEAS